MKLTRRSFVGGAVAAPFLGGPGFGQAKGSVLRVIPHADLKNIDPIWTTAYISRNHGYMVYDTLFAMDKDLKPQPQMVDKYETSADGKTWTFVLRDGLSFHDGKPVTAADCAASLIRWGKRDAMGQLMFTAVESCTARDAKTLEIKLTRPYGLLLDSIGKISSNVPFIMPKAIAETDAFKQIESAVGSGPFVFRKEQWVPGSKVVYEKIQGLRAAQGADLGRGRRQDRQGRPRRVALHSRPDHLHERADVGRGRLLRAGAGRSRADPRQGAGREDRDARSDRLAGHDALQPSGRADQQSAGAPRRSCARSARRTCSPPRSAIRNTTRSAPRSIRAARRSRARPAPNSPSRPSLDEGKKLLKESGYKGEKTVILQPSDIPISNAFALVVGKACRDIGMNVDIQSMDWSSITSRRAKKEPIDQGGWNMFPTWWIGGDLLNPLSNASLRGGPDQGVARLADRSQARRAARGFRLRDRSRRAEEGRRRRAAARLSRSAPRPTSASSSCRSAIATTSRA